MEGDPKAPAKRERKLQKDAVRAELVQQLRIEHARWLLNNDLSGQNTAPPWHLGKGYWAYLQAEIKCHEPNYQVLARATVKRDDDIWRAWVVVHQLRTGERLWAWVDPEEHCSALMAQHACIDYIAAIWPDDVRKALIEAAKQPYDPGPDLFTASLLAFLRADPLSKLEIDPKWRNAER